MANPHPSKFIQEQMSEIKYRSITNVIRSISYQKPIPDLPSKPHEHGLVHFIKYFRADLYIISDVISHKFTTLKPPAPPSTVEESTKNFIISDLMMSRSHNFGSECNNIPRP